MAMITQLGDYRRELRHTLERLAPSLNGVCFFFFAMVISMALYF